MLLWCRKGRGIYASKTNPTNANSVAKSLQCRFGLQTLIWLYDSPFRITSATQSDLGQNSLFPMLIFGFKVFRMFRNLLSIVIPSKIRVKVDYKTIVCAVLGLVSFFFQSLTLRGLVWFLVDFSYRLISF